MLPLEDFLRSLFRLRWTRQAVPPFSEGTVKRMAAMQKRQNWPASQTDLFERAAYPEIASRGNEALFERVNRVRCPPGLVIYLGQI